MEIVNDRLTQFQIAQAWDEHEESTRLFHKVIGVEHALLQQIVLAVEAKYLQAIYSCQPGTH